MSSSSSSPQDFTTDERFDGLYMTVAQTAHGIEPLLDTVFSFLRRKTDFFSVELDQVNDKVLQVLHKHAQLHRKEQEKKQQNKSSKKNEAKKKATPERNPVVEMDTEGAFDVSSSSNSGETSSGSPAAVQPPVTKKPAETASATAAPTKDITTKPEDASTSATTTTTTTTPLGNGGTVPNKYTWTQTLSEVVVSIPVPPGTRGKDLYVHIGKQTLKVGLLNDKKNLWIDDKLYNTVILDDSFWTVEDGQTLVLNLQKSNASEWWKGVCVNDPTIDVTQIRPETSSLNDLEGETRKTVEKMMYDQRQKAQGLPTSEEEEKLKMLGKFQKQHPELDFTNAKIN